MSPPHLAVDFQQKFAISFAVISLPPYSRFRPPACPLPISCPFSFLLTFPKKQDRRFSDEDFKPPTAFVPFSAARADPLPPPALIGRRFANDACRHFFFFPEKIFPPKSATAPQA